MEAKSLFKPKMQIVSFHKIDDVDDFQFDNECPDNDNPNIAFTVWADGLFNPREFDGIELIKVSELRKQIKWLREQIDKGDGSEMTMCKENIIKRIDEAFSDLSTLPKAKELNSDYDASSKVCPRCELLYEFIADKELIVEFLQSLDKEGKPS